MNNSKIFFPSLLGEHGISRRVVKDGVVSTVSLSNECTDEIIHQLLLRDSLRDKCEKYVSELHALHEDDDESRLSAEREEIFFVARAYIQKLHNPVDVAFYVDLIHETLSRVERRLNNG